VVTSNSRASSAMPYVSDMAERYLTLT